MSEAQPVLLEEKRDNQMVTRRLPKPGISDDAGAEFQRVVKGLGLDSKFTIIIAQIDPDAIGSAWGMLELLRLAGVLDVSIVYSGKVAHPQNDALCNKFGLMGKMQHISRHTSAAQLGNVVLVDSNRAADSRLPFTLDPVIVVDHHQNSDVEPGPDKLIILDEAAGSAATLILELLSQVIEDQYVMREDLALLLALGVYTDTKDLLSAGVRDRDAYGWAARYANTTDLRSLIRYKRRDSYFRNFAHALGAYKHKHGSLVATVGGIPAKQGDDLSMIADEFLRKNGVTLAVVWGIVESKNERTGDIVKGVRVCARSEDITLNLGEFLKERFGKASGAKLLPDGAGEGGALVQLDVGPWLREDEMIEIIGRRISEWLFEEIEEEV